MSRPGKAQSCLRILNDIRTLRFSLLPPPPGARAPGGQAGGKTTVTTTLVLLPGLDGTEVFFRPLLAASFVRAPLPFPSWFRFATVTPVVGLIRVARRMPAWFWTDEFRRDKAATWARVSARILAVRARAILAVDAREHLRAYPRPVLYLAGSRDTVVPARNAEEVVSVLPSTQVVTIDGPHFALYTNPQAAAHAITEFLRAAKIGQSRSNTSA